jgi:ATP-dependent Clp protease ATP-binding subunit ClpC
MFNSLSKEDINKIIDIELKGLFDRVISLGYKLKIAPAARDFIAERGFDANYGARPLKRAIQKYLEDPMEMVYDFTVPGNDSFMVDCNVLVHNTLNK